MDSADKTHKSTSKSDLKNRISSSYTPGKFFYILIIYEKVLVLCERGLSKYSLDLCVLRPPESGKMVFTSKMVKIGAFFVFSKKL